MVQWLGEVNGSLASKKERSVSIFKKSTIGNGDSYADSGKNAGSGNHYADDGDIQMRLWVQQWLNFDNAFFSVIFYTNTIW